MKRVRIRIVDLGSVLLGGALGLLFGCAKDPSQDPSAVVLQYTSPHASPGSARGLEKHSQDIVIGGDMNTPARVEWSTALDDSGCRRMQTVTVTRTGGASDFEIYKSEVRDPEQGCYDWGVMLPGPTTDGPRADQQRYDRVLLNFCYRWKGASNSADCAYSDSFMISANSIGIEK